MNINIYLEDALAKSLNQCVTQSGQSRNAIIREAIKEWVAQHEVKKWPNSILAFQGIRDSVAFESYRDDLLPPKESPFE
jgi:hypothetical protein